jgi:hypothetical protein
MASVFRPRGSRKYVIQWVDEHGRVRKKTAGTDKAVSERIARDIENRVALRREGLIDPAAERAADHERTPVNVHLDAWSTALIAKGATTKHAELHATRARRVAEAAGLTRLSEMTPARVQAALASLRAVGRSAATVNHHRNAIRGFSRWCWKEGRTASDALVGVTPYNADADGRHDRRTLSIEELSRLVGAAHGGASHRRMTGPARASGDRVRSARTGQQKL